MAGRGDGGPDEQERELLRQIDFARIPRHVAVIMDGNGRWAKKRGLPRIAGHRAGIAAVREVLETSARLGVEVLTLYAFSRENWRRPSREVNALMRLLREYLDRELANIHERNVRFDTIGRIDELTGRVQEDLVRAREKTRLNSGMRFLIALSYSGRTEIADVARRIAEEAKEGSLDPATVDEDLFDARLETAGLPDPDLLVRSSGEMRVSNFLLWQIAYAELWVTPVLWPDFRRAHLYEAILDYQRRERRFGRVAPRTEKVEASRGTTRRGGA